MTVPGARLAAALRGAPTALLLLLILLPASSFGQDGRPRMPGGDPARGRVAIERYACTACHAIPGIPGYGSNVGPPLDKMAVRAYIGGVLPNLPEEMVRWLRDPPAIDPRTVMPNMGVSEAEAKDIAAYLYTLD